MTKDKVQEVIQLYRRIFKSLGSIPKQIDVHSEILNPLKDDTKIINHCHGMLDDMEVFLKEGRVEKAFRWLGFVQGCLWSLGYHPLEKLKDHNRSKDKEEH